MLPDAHDRSLDARVHRPEHARGEQPHVDRHRTPAAGLHRGRMLERELAPLIPRFPEVFPTRVPRRVDARPPASPSPSRRFATGSSATSSRARSGSCSAPSRCVFLVAAANVANLFLVRLDARRRELAMRMALGAGRSHLAAHFLAEGLVLSLAAAALGVALAYGGAARARSPVRPTASRGSREVHLGWRERRGRRRCSRVVTGAVLRAHPDRQRARGRAARCAKARERSRRAVAGTPCAARSSRDRSRSRSSCSRPRASWCKSFRNLRGVQPGFDPNGVVTMAVSLPGARYDNDRRRARAFFEQLATEIRGDA